jgi:hypothetical protein
MTHPVEILRQRARVLQRQAERGDEGALTRISKHPDFKGKPVNGVRTEMRRRHCLAVLANEYGFDGWGHLKRIVEGAVDGDFGTGLYSRDCFSHWNIWSASYDEAKAIREEHGGFLLPYEKQFLIVDRYFIDTIGLDPDDPDWDAMGRNWVQPTDASARKRLYAKLFDRDAASMRPLKAPEAGPRSERPSAP